MTEGLPEDLPDEAIPASEEQPDPEEYEPDDDIRAVSSATGTVYDELGEPGSTAHDNVAAGDEDVLP